MVLSALKAIVQFLTWRCLDERSSTCKFQHIPARRDLVIYSRFGRRHSRGLLFLSLSNWPGRIQLAYRPSLYRATTRTRRAIKVFTRPLDPRWVFAAVDGLRNLGVPERQGSGVNPGKMLERNLCGVTMGAEFGSDTRLACKDR